MKRSILFAGVLLGMITGSAATAETKPAAMASGTFATATGVAAGTASVEAPASGAPVLHIHVSGLPAGPHGVHLHMTGKCDGPTFGTAGGHLNPGGRQHGKNNPAGSHLGDLPNLTVNEQGAGDLSATMAVNAATLRAQLFDADGTAVVIHAKADDYRTDPSGNSGDRIACAVLKAG